MKKNTFIFFISLGLSSITWAQVGINNPNPTATLDVIGNVLVEEKLFLEAPGNYSQIRGSKLLIKKTDEQVVQYDIDASKYGPINYVEFVFKNTNTNGLKNYDTKISATNYLVTVQGFYFLISGTNDTNITVKSTRDNSKVEGFQVYAYINPSTNTWWIKGFVNNSTFQNNSYANSAIDLYMNLIIFRNGFIAKPLDDVIVNMSNSETKTVPLPEGF